MLSDCKQTHLMCTFFASRPAGFEHCVNEIKMKFVFLAAFLAVNCDELATVYIPAARNAAQYKVITNQAHSYKRFEFNAADIENAIFIGIGHSSDVRQKHIEIVIGGRVGTLSYIMETTGQIGDGRVARRDYVHKEHSKQYFDSVKSKLSLIIEGGRVQVYGGDELFMEWVNPNISKKDLKYVMAHGWCCSGNLYTNASKNDPVQSHLHIFKDHYNYKHITDQADQYESFTFNAENIENAIFIGIMEDDQPSKPHWQIMLGGGQGKQSLLMKYSGNLPNSDVAKESFVFKAGLG